MTWRAVLFLTFLASAIWGFGMTRFFGWPKDQILAPMGLFGLLMAAMLGLGKLMAQKKGRER